MPQLLENARRLAARLPADQPRLADLLRDIAETQQKAQERSSMNALDRDDFFEYFDDQ